MRGLCQHTDAILVNMHKAGPVDRKIGGWGEIKICLSLERGKAVLNVFEKKDDS